MCRLRDVFPLNFMVKSSKWHSMRAIASWIWHVCLSCSHPRPCTLGNFWQQNIRAATVCCGQVYCSESSRERLVTRCGLYPLYWRWQDRWGGLFLVGGQRVRNHCDCGKEADQRLWLIAIDLMFAGVAKFYLDTVDTVESLLSIARAWSPACWYRVRIVAVEFDPK